MNVSRGIALAVLGWWSFGLALASASQEEIPKSKPTNLQVLPQDLSPAKLGKLMRRFSKDLGVKCSHCHVEVPHTQKLDYASDDNPRKVTARLMISMVKDINENYLAQLGGDRRYSVPVTCGSCHQGQSTPPEFEGKW